MTGSDGEAVQFPARGGVGEAGSRDKLDAEGLWEGEVTGDILRARCIGEKELEGVGTSHSTMVNSADCVSIDDVEGRDAEGHANPANVAARDRDVHAEEVGGVRQDGDGCLNEGIAGDQEGGAVGGPAGSGPGGSDVGIGSADGSGAVEGVFEQGDGLGATCTEGGEGASCDEGLMRFHVSILSGVVVGCPLHLIMKHCAAMDSDFLEMIQKRIPHWSASVAGC